MPAAPYQFVLGTWNSFGTPQSADAAILGFAPYPARFVSRVLRDGAESPDLLCVQEILSSDARSFFDGLHGFKSLTRDRATMTESSGLGVASRFVPTAKTGVFHFTDSGASTDKLIRKGVMHVRVPLTRGPELDVVTTHLQSDNDPDERAVRRHQLAELTAYVARVADPKRPLVVCGDFNIDGLRAADGRRSDEYALLLAALPGLADLGANNDVPTSDPKSNAMLRAYDPAAPTERIDYVFFRPGSADPTALRPTAINHLLQHYLSDLPVQQWIPVGAVARCPPFASDHYGLQVSFAYDPRP